MRCRHGCLAVVAVMALSSCSGAATSPSPGGVRPAASPGAGAPGAVTGTPSPTPAATPPATPPPPTTLAMCPSARPARTLHVVHSFNFSPDDVTVDAAGRLWVTAREANLLVGMDQSGGSVTTQAVSGGPEGVASDGTTLYVALQDDNTVMALGPPRRTVWSVANHTGNDGVDGIAWDAPRGRLLVPDSPTGELDAVLPGAAAPVRLATGLGRPVAATADPAGDVFVASETSPALTELTAGGARRALGHVADLDEVAWYAGLLYVTELDRGDVVAVDPASGASAVLGTGLPAPQGLAVTAGGTLEIVDSTTDRLYSMPACGVAG